MHDKTMEALEILCKSADQMLCGIAESAQHNGLMLADDDLERLKYLKSVYTIAAMKEAEEEDYGEEYGGFSMRGGSNGMRGRSYEGGMNASGRRGRSRTTGRYVSRDGGSMRGMSRDGDMGQALEEAKAAIKRLEDMQGQQ